jgi:7,8-dihydropterin-6-yl-methyl-4-(beta-D-ribofuranosyl)aminobenzene 5'-phosphate synthase
MGRLIRSIKPCVRFKRNLWSSPLQAAELSNGVKRSSTMRENKSATFGSNTLEPVDGVEVTVLVDNFIDSTLKSSTWVSRHRDRKVDEPLFAEHGLSLFVEIVNKGVKSGFLLDTGSTPCGITYNAEKMGVDLKGLEGIFLSHNHKDHTTGLETVLAITGPIPVFMHPYGFYTKWVKSKPSRLDKDHLADLGALWRAEEGPQLMASSLLTSGSIPRTTEFEEIIGLSDRKVEKDGIMEPEAF